MKVEMQDKIAANLRILRNDSNLSQEELSKVVRIDRSVYSQYENGHRVPPLEILYDLAKFFGVSVEMVLETHPKNLLGEINYARVSDDEERRILSIFRSLSPFSKGRLVERAEILAKWDVSRLNQQNILKSQNQSDKASR